MILNIFIKLIFTEHTKKKSKQIKSITKKLKKKLLEDGELDKKK